MARIIILSLFVLSLMPAAHAQAERNVKGGMSYVVVSDGDTPVPAAPAKPNTMKSKRIYNTATPDQETESKTTPEGIAADIWEKYKELAAGQDKEPEELEPTRHRAPDKPEPPQQDSAGTAKPETPMTGLAGIIARYHEKKEARSQMRSIQVNKPAKPQVEKPTAPAANSKAE
jgi:hypothetical protein